MGNEINRRIKAGWKSFNEHKIVLKSNIPNSLKKKLCNQYMLPAMTYASDTWTLSKAWERCLAAAQRNMKMEWLVCPGKIIGQISGLGAKPSFVTSCKSIEPENGLGPVTWLAFKTINGHPK